MQKKQFDLNLKVDFSSKYVKGNEADYLTKACILQFPYGVGGLNEKILLQDESYCENVDTEAYLRQMDNLVEFTCACSHMDGVRFFLPVDFCLLIFGTSVDIRIKILLLHLVLPLNWDSCTTLQVGLDFLLSK